MLFERITVLDEGLKIRHDQYVGVKGGRIAYLGEKPPAEEDFGERYDGRGKLLMSGLINAHTHTPMTLMRGYAENKTLQDWLYNNIFPFEAQLKGSDVYYGTMLGIAEMLRYGTVSSTDMYFFTEEILRAVSDSGFKMNLSSCIACRDDTPLSNLPAHQKAKHLYERYHGSEGGRIKVDMSLHAEYTTTPKVISEFVEYCQEIDANVHIHLSETKLEVEECKARHNGMTPPAYFWSLGLLDIPTVAAHCVWLENGDFDILREKKTVVAHCPVSNLKLASGVADVPRMLEYGIPVALGTDSVASNNNLNLMEEIKLFAILHKGMTGDPTRITPAEAILCATKHGAQAQRRPDCGTLKIGNRADLAVFDLTGPNMHPAHDLLSNIVYSLNGADTVLTMVDGRVLYRNGQYLTIDLERIYFELEKSKENILKVLKSER